MALFQLFGVAAMKLKMTCFNGTISQTFNVFTMYVVKKGLCDLFIYFYLSREYTMLFAI